MLSPQVHKLVVLEKKYAIDVLLLLLNRGPLPKQDLYQILTTNTAPVEDRVNELKDLGLITETSVKRERWRYKQVELTDRGRRLSEALMAAEKVIKESG